MQMEERVAGMAKVWWYVCVEVLIYEDMELLRYGAMKVWMYEDIEL